MGSGVSDERLLGETLPQGCGAVALPGHACGLCADRSESWRLKGRSPAHKRGQKAAHTEEENKLYTCRNESQNTQIPGRDDVPS